MEERSVEWSEGTFNIVWLQHNPDDWVAEVIDTRSGRRTQVYSLEELTRFIQSRLRTEVSQPADP